MELETRSSKIVVRLAALLAAAVLHVALCERAFAQEIQLTGPLEGAPAVSRHSYSSRHGNAIVMPTGTIEAGGEMAFVTAEPSPYEAELEFTDLALLRLRARRSFSDSVELMLATTLLPKQPSDSGEPIWQGAFVGARLAFAKHFASSLSAGGGPMLGHRGRWWKMGPGLLAKFDAGDLLRFALNAGGSLTILDFERERQQPFWIEELTTGGEVQLGDRHAAGWVRLDYEIPIAHNPESDAPDRMSGQALDPQVALSLELGGILTPETDWDVYATYSVIDRGELARPSTTLPILDGGFDQRQIVVGVQHRFGRVDERREMYPE